MRASFLLVLSFFLLTSIISCQFIEAKKSIYIAKYPEDRPAAVSFTFDDNNPSCISKIAPMFKKHKMKATFFVIPNQVPDPQWPDWKKLSDEGFEIANHSLNHLTLTNIPDSVQLDEEINGAFEIIETKIGIAPFSFAHPGHITNSTVDRFVFKKHFATRVYPVGFCQWWGVVSNSDEKMLAKNLRDAKKKHDWLVFAAHGVGDGWEPITEDFLENCMKSVIINESDFWIDHFGNLAKYKIERLNTTLHYTELSGDLEINLESALDTTIFNFPLTIVLEGNNYENLRIVSGKGEIVPLFKGMNKTMLKLLPKSKVIIAK